MTERTAEYWLKKAEEARTRAAGMQEALARDSMLVIAEKYDTMARRVEGLQVRARTRTDKRR